MKNSLIKRILVFFITIVFFTGLFQGIFNEKVEAATKPGKPSITVKAGDDGKSAIITIEKTKNAQGYQETGFFQIRQYNDLKEGWNGKKNLYRYGLG